MKWGRSQAADAANCNAWQDPLIVNEAIAHLRTANCRASDLSALVAGHLSGTRPRANLRDIADQPSQPLAIDHSCVNLCSPEALHHRPIIAPKEPRIAGIAIHLPV